MVPWPRASHFPRRCLQGCRCTWPGAVLLACTPPGSAATLSHSTSGPLRPLITCTVEGPRADEVTTPRCRPAKLTRLQHFSPWRRLREPVRKIDLRCVESNRVQTGVGAGGKGACVRVNLRPVVSLLQLQAPGEDQLAGFQTSHFASWVTSNPTGR